MSGHLEASPSSSERRQSHQEAREERRASLSPYSSTMAKKKGKAPAQAGQGPAENGEKGAADAAGLARGQAEQWKNLGNEEFKAGNYQKAIEV